MPDECLRIKVSLPNGLESDMGRGLLVNKSTGSSLWYCDACANMFNILTGRGEEADVKHGYSPIILPSQIN